jgi:hypothetical protein
MLVGKPESKRPLGSYRCSWDNITIDLVEVGWEGVDWILWLRIGTIGGLMNFWVP